MTGEILATWLAQGGPTGPLGYPVADEQPLELAVAGGAGRVSTGRVSRFEHGEITWSAAGGAIVRR